MNKRSRQAGLGAVVFLFVAVVVLAAALMAFRTVPSYIEYFTIKKAVQGALADSNDGSMASVQRAFERRIGADYVDSVGWRDLQVVREGSDIVGKIDWEKRLPLFYNVSLLLDFEINVVR